MIDSLKVFNVDDEDFIAWREKTKAILRKIFGIESAQEKDFEGIWFTTMSLGGDVNDRYERQAYQRGLISAKSKIEGMIEYLDDNFD